MVFGVTGMQGWLRTREVVESFQVQLAMSADWAGIREL